MTRFECALCLHQTRCVYAGEFGDSADVHSLIGRVLKEASIGRSLEEASIDLRRGLERLKLGAFVAPRQMLERVLWREGKLRPGASLKPLLDESASKRKLRARRKQSREARLAGEGVGALGVQVEVRLLFAVVPFGTMGHPVILATR